MSQDVKFTEEEMTTVKKIQQDYLETQQTLGQISVTEIRLQQQLESLTTHRTETIKKFQDTQEHEIKFISDVTAKYGNGTLNPTTGVFTLNKTE